MRRPAVALGLLVLLLWHGAAGEALACRTCYGDAEGSLVDGARMGIWLLLGITFAVQGAFIAFFLHLRRQARRTASEQLDSEWSRLQREFSSGRRTLEHP